MIALSIDSPLVMKVLYSVEPYCPHHGEISEAITGAANADPLFPDRFDGCFRTAAILVALAWLTSRFRPNIVGNNGTTFGLYGIRPPASDANGKAITTNMLSNPRDASYIAIDLIRESMRKDCGRTWEERLFGYWDAQAHDSPMHQSLQVMLLADNITKNHFPPEMRALPPPLPELPAGASA
jgi:hypothetical protein